MQVGSFQKPTNAEGVEDLLNLLVPVPRCCVGFSLAMRETQNS